MDVNQIIQKAAAEFEKAVKHLQGEYARLQVGRASAALVEGIIVEAYGVSQPLKALASIAIPDPRTIQIQPWDRNILSAIEKAIVGIGTGLNPINDGICIRINIPPLTEERRIELTKHVKRLAEDARVAVRNARQEAHNEFKSLRASSDITEDDFYKADKDLQLKVDDANKKIDEIATTKERDVMTV